jgi:hypothetical protein
MDNRRLRRSERWRYTQVMYGSMFSVSHNIHNSVCTNFVRSPYIIIMYGSTSLTIGGRIEWTGCLLSFELHSANLWNFILRLANIWASTHRHTHTYSGPKIIFSIGLIVKFPLFLRRPQTWFESHPNSHICTYNRRRAYIVIEIVWYLSLRLLLSDVCLRTLFFAICSPVLLSLFPLRSVPRYGHMYFWSNFWDGHFDDYGHQMFELWPSRSPIY